MLDAAAAVLAALLAFTAVPAVLFFVVGDPLSGGLGHAWRPLPRDALCLLTLAAWLAWAACCAQLVRAVVAQVRSGEVGADRGASVMDRVAARIAIGVLALTSVGAPLALSSAAGATTTPSNGHVGVGLLAPTAPEAQRAAARATHAVQPGDTLWRIADERLGDGADWTAIAALNLGRTMAGGARFVDPDQIRAGWRLHLPLAAVATDEHRPSGDTRGGSTARPGEHLPEMIALGLGSLACAALARQARRRHRIDRFNGDLGLRGPVSDDAVDAATLLCRFAEVPALHSFEAANCLLGRTLLDDPAGPKVRAICVSDSGVTFWLTAPLGDAPGAFEPVQGGAAWHVDHGALGEQDAFTPYVPLALPVGDDAEGTWLVALGPGDVLPLLGEAAPSLLRAMRAAAGAWAWSDMIAVSDDPDDPAARLPLPTVPPGTRHHLFFGDPASVPPEMARHGAVVTTTTVAASNLTILVDRQGATLHPMGRVVRPHLQSMEMAGALTELMAAPDEGDDETRRANSERLPAPAAGDGTSALSPGAVDVRLLTMTPRLDGLCEDLPPNRARRAVELVAYLALHQPDGITGDRLRTRVLGSSDADAAAKTLFNTAYAARRAMGVDERGEPLFPTGSRTGLYQVSRHVTVDVHRAIALAMEGRSQADPAVAIAHFRAALDLVEGEPLANALSGYAWWEAEGHGGRIAAVLVDAACSMAVLAADAGHFELARWGLERARLVEPYSEALSRAAMQLAATEGDADRLRFEWRECQRRVDALDPGSSPSTRTESLYGALSRRVHVGAASSEADRTGYAPAASD
jgi:DNA-binding SARP family transcriptional activator